MNVKHYIVIFLSLLLFSTDLIAKQLSPQQAVARVVDANKSALKSARGSNLQQLRTVSDSLGNNVLYIFKNKLDGRLMFVSADDCAKPLLGYTEGPAELDDELPEPLSVWLDSYKHQISYRITHPEELVQKTVTVVEKKMLKSAENDLSAENDFPSIDVLLPYEWGTKPFNDLCPRVDDTLKTLVGCVALSMYQVMSYYQYPTRGRDSVILATQVEGKDTVLMLDMSNSVYDWEALKDLESEKGKAAAAILGRDCAYSVRAKFGLHSTSAKTVNVQKALLRHFAYDSSMVCVGRSTDEEWFRILYNELENGRPVIYAASGSYGHAFVCDGYNADDKTFHFNWNWYGKYNGFYSLSALNPGPDVFDEDHLALIGIQPPGFTKKGSDHVFAYGDLMFKPSVSAREGCNTKVRMNPTTNSTDFASAGIYFAPPIYPTAQIAMLLKDDTSKEDSYFFLIGDYGKLVWNVDATYDESLYQAFNCFFLQNSYNFLNSDSTFTVRFAYRDSPEDSWKLVHQPNGGRDYARSRLCENGMFIPIEDEGVGPLLSTNWTESYINFYCPWWSNNGVRCGAGYDATAIGQMIYTLNAPNKVFGDIRYGDVDLQDLDYHFNFENYVTPDVPYIGKAIRTKYDRKSTIYGVPALVYGLHKNMGLTNCQFMSRKFYTTAQWKETIASQLYQGSPLYYCGYHVNGADSTRRAFVLDGYNKDGYHINFGDGGIGDKYLDLNVINNMGTTPGNTDVCFAFDQGMLIDFYTQCEVDTISGGPDHPFMLMSPIVVNDDPTLTHLNINSNEQLKVSFSLTDCTKESIDYDADGAVFVAVGVYQNGDLKYVLGKTEYKVNQQEGSVNASFGNIHTGSYNLALITSIDGKNWDRVFNNAPNTMSLSVTKESTMLDVPFNPTIGAVLSMASAHEVIADSVKGVLLHLPLANETSSNYNDYLRIEVATADAGQLVYDAQPVAMYGDTKVDYDIVLPAHIVNALGAGGKLSAYYRKGDVWLPLFGETGVDGVKNSMDNSPIGVQVYKADGALLKSFTSSQIQTSYSQFLSSLPAGVYVIVENGVSRKFVRSAH